MHGAQQRINKEVFKMKNIAILGFGVVGSGVAEVLAMNAAKIENQVGDKVNIKYILDLRKFPGSPFEALVTDDAEKVFSDPDVTVLVETIVSLHRIRSL